jgi:glycine cleavage system H protein
MSTYPLDYYYTKDHEWVRVDGETGTVGITHHAQQQLGDVVYVELPAVGSTYAAGAPFGQVESVKAVSELYLPINGEVTEVNGALADSPEIINEDPHGEGWMVIIKIQDPGQLSGLLRAADYERYAKEEGGN